MSMRTEINSAGTAPRSGLRVLAALCLIVLTAAATMQARAPKPLTFDDPLSDGPVFVVPVEGMIDKPLARYI